MNTVLNSYGQLCGCPEILKKSYKFFCRGLDIRVPQAVEYDFLGIHIRIIHFSQDFLKPLIQVFRHNGTSIGLTDGKVIIHVTI